MSTPYNVEKKHLRVSHYELASLANAVYDVGRGIKLPDGWNIKDSYYPNNNKDLGVAIYMNSNLRSIVIAVRGSDNPNDLVEDVKLALGAIPNQTPILSTMIREAEKIVTTEKDKEAKKTGSNRKRPEATSSASTREEHPSEIPPEFTAFSDTPRQIASSLEEDDFSAKYLLEIQTAIFTAVGTVTGAYLATSAGGVNVLAVAGGSAMGAAIGAQIAKAYIKDQIGEARYNELTQGGELEINERMRVNIDTAIKNMVSELTSSLYLSFDPNPPVPDLPDYEIVVTGHSLGGAYAEIIAACAEIPAVTFETPGTQALIKKQGHKINEKFVEENFVCYLGAPNLVNTLYQHMGTCVRMLINKDAKNSWKFIFNASFNTVKQATVGTLICVAAPAAATAGSTVFAASTAATATGIVASASGAALAAAEAVVAAATASVTAAAASGLVPVALGSAAGSECVQLFRDWKYLVEQHSLDNIISCFNEETRCVDRNKALKVISWPYRGVSGIVFGTKISSFFNSFNPIATDQPNIRTLLFWSEKDVLENQIKKMPNYKVEPLLEATEDYEATAHPRKTAPTVG